LLKRSAVVLVPESEEERTALGAWQSRYEDYVFSTTEKSASEAGLVALGPRLQVCREPINVTSRSPEPIRLIANFAATPFELDGVRYACVEAFWQSLRFLPEDRARIAAMDGATAKRESVAAPYGSHVTYGGRSIAVGTFDHWQLMRRACRAKFEQNPPALTALLATGGRPLVHVVRPDSRTIPGVIMAEIWMALRSELARSRSRISRQTPP
jgi:predicted NAD-dependent protein-ADP-ribosyltransferase YbiA (DUF1768 family)